VSGGQGQTLCSGAQRQDKGQRAQTEAEVVPAEQEEELLPSEGDGALEQAAQGGCGVPIPGGVQKTCRFFRTWFSRHGGAGLVVGLDDLRGLFQPSSFYDPMCYFQLLAGFLQSFLSGVLNSAVFLYSVTLGSPG